MAWTMVVSLTGNVVYGVHVTLMGMATILEPPRADNPVTNSLRYRVLYAVCNASAFNWGQARNRVQAEPRREE
jgi:hypothetical protein